MSEHAERLQERLLVVRCQTGDEAAYAELIERYGPRLRYFVRKRLGRDDAVDDVLQEVWIDVFRQLPRLNDVGAFAAWIYRIARGKAVLDVRRNGDGRHALQEAGEIAAPEAEPEFSADDAARIHIALDQLPAEQREVLVLRFMEAMSYDDIGQVIGCPVGTVRSRIFYGKQALKRLLSDEVGET